ncbi:hypothetical protein pb186bvf_011135 [Paramecium bursaria]
MQKLLNETLSQKEADQIWAELEIACYRLSKQETKYLSFQELYHGAYKLIIHKYSDMTHDNLIKTFQVIINEQVSKIGYESVGDFIKIFEDVKSFSQHISGVFLYMEKNYLIPKKQKTFQQIIFELFKTKCFDDQGLSNRIVQSLLSIVKQDRTGQQSDKNKLKAALQILIDLNQKTLFKNNQYKIDVEYIQNEEFYKNQFERKYLNETQKFYKDEFQQYINQSLWVEDFIKKINERYQQEKQRMQYFPKCSHIKIQDTFIKSTIQQYYPDIIQKGQGLFEFLANNQINIVIEIYKLFVLNDEAFNAFSLAFHQYVASTGKEILRNNQNVLEDFIELYNRVLSINQQLQLYGSQEQKFLLDKQIKDSLCSVVNSSNQIMQQLSKYFDELLKKGINDSQIETGFNIFKLIYSKDSFELMYRKGLCSRLLDGNSVSEDQERLLINRFKVECGSVMTMKMEIMYQDIFKSNNEYLEYKFYLDSKRIQSDFEIKILSQGNWPIKEQNNFALHEDLQYLKTLYDNYYINHHSKRKLFWCYHLGFVNIKGSFDQKKELVCSVLQANILLFFNQLRTFKVQSLVQLIGQEQEIIQQEIQPMIQLGLLIQNGDVLSSKLKLQRLKVKQEQLNNDNDTKELILDRKLYLESLIVRIMKARKQLTHDELLIEVEKLYKFFVPDQQLFKGCVESLIWKDYMVRDGVSSYVYKA